jgi:RHS repeat-associated protein
VVSTATEYVFSAAGQRVSEWNGTTRAELQGKYYWGAKPVAYYVAGGAAHFEHLDWLGTERMRTTYNGGVEGSYISLPFGDGQATTGADTDANHYGMLDSDPESGTEHAQFRQYSEAQGRWLSPDPDSGSYSMRNPQSFNRYVYAGNNPLAAVDPSGLEYVTPEPNGPTPEDPVMDGTDTAPGTEGEDMSLTFAGLAYYGKSGFINIDCPAGCYVPSLTESGCWDFMIGNGSGTDDYVDAHCGSLTPSRGSTSGNSVAANGSSGGAPNTVGGTAPSNGYKGTFYRFPLVPGTNYCGPGGWGPILTKVDNTCFQHDACYNNADASFFNNVTGSGGPAKQAAIANCNQNLCSSVASLNNLTSQEMGQALFVQVAFGCH